MPVPTRRRWWNATVWFLTACTTPQTGSCPTAVGNYGGTEPPCTAPPFGEVALAAVDSVSRISFAVPSPREAVVEQGDSVFVVGMRMRTCGWYGGYQLSDLAWSLRTDSTGHVDVATTAEQAATAPVVARALNPGLTTLLGTHRDPTVASGLRHSALDVRVGYRVTTLVPSVRDTTVAVRDTLVLTLTGRDASGATVPLLVGQLGVASDGSLIQLGILPAGIELVQDPVSSGRVVVRILPSSVVNRLWEFGSRHAAAQALVVRRTP
ncbi:MAG: hypothetical protein HY275_02740 [Gemmatimonadetes bacterium]|nr:hypothetical protein [Gemmatimonadota bacterium]